MSNYLGFSNMDYTASKTITFPATVTTADMTPEEKAAYEKAQGIEPKKPGFPWWILLVIGGIYAYNKMGG
jgi:hypothetical protein